MVVTEKDTNVKLKDLIERAKKCDNKGRMYVYEMFKGELQSLNVSPQEYEQTCRKLAKYLRV